MNLKNFYILCVLFLSLGFIQCGTSSLGGSEAGNPAATRAVTGDVDSASPSTSAALMVSHLATSCQADSVMATNSSGESTLADMDADCAFELDLETGKAYAISFISDDEFVGTLTVNNVASALDSTVIILSAGSTSVNLGRITFSAGQALPANQPALQNDQDEDGVDDFTDDDDDDDGILDENEEDCDFDGFWNDFDDDETDCETESGGGDVLSILEVTPRNSETHVDLDEDILARFDCEIDEASVNATTFAVVSSTGTAIDCDYILSGSDERVECQHDADEFLTNTIYTATIDGVSCADGTGIEPISWSWRSDTH